MDIKITAVKSFFWNHCAKVSDHVLAYIFSILLVRKLPIDEFGLYVMIISITTVFINFSSLGIDTLINKYVAQYNDKNNNIESIRYMVRKSLFVRIIVSLILSMLLFAFYQFNMIDYGSISEYLILIILFIFLQNILLFNASLCQGLLDTKYVLIVNILSRSLNLFIGYIILFQGYGIHELLLLLLFSSFFSCLLYLHNNKNYIFGSIKYEDVNPMVKFALSAWIISILTFILGKQADVIMINYYLNSKSQIAYYEAAFSLSQALSYVFLIGLSGVSLAMFSKIAKNDLNKLEKTWTFILKVMQVLLIPLIIFFITYSNILIPFIYGSSYYDSIILFQILIFFMLISWVIGGGMNLTMLYALNLEKKVLLSRVIAGLINIILNIILIPQLGALGAIVSTGFSTILVIMIEYVFLKSFISISFPFLYFFKILLISLISIFSLSFYDGSNIINVACFFFQYAFLIIVLSYLLKIFKPIEMLKFYNGIVK